MKKSCPKTVLFFIHLMTMPRARRFRGILMRKRAVLRTALFHAWYYLFSYFWFLYRIPHSLLTQGFQFVFRLLFFVEDLEVRVDLTDAHVTSLVVLQNFEELTGQHDDYEQIYVGR